MRRAVFAIALVIMFTGSGYVRRSWLPPERAKVTQLGGSSDRHLHGKARVRARRAAA